MRVATSPATRVIDTHLLKQFHGALVGLNLCESLMGLKHLTNLPPHGKKRVKSRHGLLKDHRNFFAAQPTQARWRGTMKLLAFPLNGAS